MFKQVYIFILTLLLCFTLSISSDSRPVMAQNNLPPVIDREIFFGNPEVNSSRSASRIKTR
jgi:hypothetical protein